MEKYEIARDCWCFCVILITFITALWGFLLSVYDGGKKKIIVTVAYLALLFILVFFYAIDTYREYSRLAEKIYYEVTIDEKDLYLAKYVTDRKNNRIVIINKYPVNVNSRVYGIDITLLDGSKLFFSTDEHRIDIKLKIKD